MVQTNPTAPETWDPAVPLVETAGQHSGWNPAGARREWRLTATPRSVTVMRGRLRVFLREGGIPEDSVYNWLLAAGEAATNAVEHAQRPTEPFVEVCAEIVDGRVTIVVRDHGRWRTPRKDPDRGRGLTLMHFLTDATLVCRPDGTTVTMRSHGPASDRTGRG